MLYSRAVIFSEIAQLNILSLVLTTISMGFPYKGSTIVN